MSKVSRLGASLVTDRYLEERVSPSPGDFFYLHLSDLLMAMRKECTADRVRLLDFGCGGSPYRSLFPGADYRRADISGTPDIDYVIPTDPPGAGIDAPNGSFDFILSSQVLEHVMEPRAYLRECHRLLAPGGRLLISTHGTFEEHGCPHDYFRWTAGGLSKELALAGFAVNRSYKLTVGTRAVLFLYRMDVPLVSRKRILGLCLAPLNWLIRNRPAAFDRQCDLLFPNHRVVDGNCERSRMYVGVLAAATKI